MPDLKHRVVADRSRCSPELRERLRDDLDFIPDDPAELRRAVTRMAAHINHADWRFIKLIAAMDRTRGWAESGLRQSRQLARPLLARGKPLRGPPSRSPAEGSRCGLGPCAARERIRIGRALARLPQIDAAFRDGVLSYSKVRAITRVATRESEAVLLDIAGSSSAAQLESLVRTHERIGGDERERVRSEERRGLNWYYEDGMVVITAAVPAERGALVIQALKKVVDGRKDEREAYYQALLEGEEQHGPDDAARKRNAPGDVSRKRRARTRTHRPAGRTEVRTLRHGATPCRRPRRAGRALPGERPRQTRPALRGGAHDRAERARGAVSKRRCSLPRRPGLGHRRGGCPPDRLRHGHHGVH